MHKNITAGVAGALVLSLAVPVFAQGVGVRATTGARVGSTTVEANMEARMSLAKERADQEIARRIAMLESLSARVQAMLRVSATQRSATSQAVESQVAMLTSLRARIAADADIETLREDIKSIATSYRIFVLVIPQTRILLAAEKLQTAASSMAEFSAKLQARISAAQTSGNDVTELSRLLSDMNENIASAQELAREAVSLVADLKPDNGDKATQEANASAMREARAKIQEALADLKAARQDAGAIVKGLKDLSADASASGEASVETQ